MSLVFFQNIQRYFLFCIEWIYGALFHISTTLCDVKQLKDKFVTLFKVNSFWLHIHSMPWTFKKKYLHTLICQIRRSIRSKIPCLCRFDIGEKKRAIKIERCKIRAKWWLIGNISHFIFNPLMLLINICPRHLLGHLRTFCFTLEIFLLAYKIQ